MKQWDQFDEIRERLGVGVAFTWLVLLGFAGGRGGICFATMRTIQERRGGKERALQGHLAALKRAGIAEVWGLDPSPYMLQHAARAIPQVRFVQGVAERSGFADARFDGVAACFVLHEIPARLLADCLREFARILKPGGMLAICEPSAQHWRLSLRNLRPANLYFHLLAHRAHDPYVQAWHRYDIAVALDAAGFDLLQDIDAMPVRHLFARKRTLA